MSRSDAQLHHVLRLRPHRLRRVMGRRTHLGKYLQRYRHRAPRGHALPPAHPPPPAAQVGEVHGQPGLPPVRPAQCPGAACAAFRDRGGHVESVIPVGGLQIRTRSARFIVVFNVYFS